jgi:GTPase SAR1 family protein/Leucine-rich repeat (LRR) protein
MAARQVLLEFYHALGGGEWVNDTNWNSNKPLNGWFGITVNENDNLLEINLENNNLVGTLPDGIGNSSSLVRLNLRGNKISGPLPNGLGRCASLKELGLSRNLITGCIPESLGKCSKLEYLGLSNNRLIDNIPDSLGRCTRLREVSLGSNKLSGPIPETLGRCIKLATLSLMDNNLSGELPICFGKMIGLQKLLLDRNSFTGQLPSSFGNLVKLRQLSVADNDFNGYFPEQMRHCVSLKRLNISGNSFAGPISDGVGNCEALESLFIQGNRLTCLDGLRNLKKLKTLDLNLPEVIDDLPPEFHDKDIQIILSYLREIYLTTNNIVEEDVKVEATVTVKRVKLMFIGPGEAGKTTLIHRLREGKFEGGFGMTDGVSMTDWTIDELRMSCWDFSGQGVYMNTHSLFFSERTVFVLVWNPRQQENQASLDLFFHTIRNASPKAPIILVTTHSKDTSKTSDGILDSFNERFGQPAGFGKIACYHHIDSSTGVGIQELKTDICKISLRQKFVTQKIPKSYKRLEGGLKDLAKYGRFSLTGREARNFAYEQYKIDDFSCDVALDLFHDWGFIHILPGGDVILEPKKLADVFSCAISYKAEKIYAMGDGKLGLLRHDEIDLVWRNYDVHLQPQFLQMMHDHKLAYPLYDSHSSPLEASIVPAMLPEEPLGGGRFPTENELRALFFPEHAKLQATVRIQFDFLPVNLLPMLQVRLCALATLGGAWKYGCALQLESFCRANEKTISQSYAILKSDPHLNCIDVISGGDTTAARSVALRSLVAIRDAHFKGLEFIDVKINYNSEPLASRKLIERKLKRDPNAVILYEGDEGDTGVPLRGLQFLFNPSVPDVDKDVRKKKTRMIHEELVKMYMVSNENKETDDTTPPPAVTKEEADETAMNTLRNEGGKLKGLDNLITDPTAAMFSKSGGSTLMGMLKKKLDKIHASEEAALEGKKKKKAVIIDYRQVMPQSIIDLEAAIVKANNNPEELDEFLDLENQLTIAIEDILLFGCNVPPLLSNIHTLWVSYGDGTMMVPLSPPEKPTKEWEVIGDARTKLIPRSSRSDMPHVNKDISDTVLRALQVLGIECPAPPPKVVKQTDGASDSKVITTTTSHSNPQFAASAKWFGLVDMSHTIEEVKHKQETYFDLVENQEMKKIYIAKTIASRIHAPNMAVSDQVFRKLFQGLKGQGANPHISLLRTAIDSITPISVTINPRSDVFLSHTGKSADIKAVKAIAEYLSSKGLVVWIDPKRKTGINKMHMTGIDNSSLFVMCVSEIYMAAFNRAEVNEKKKEEGKLGIKACEDTCYLQYNYARKRKTAARIIPILIDDAIFKEKKKSDHADALEEEKAEDDQGEGGKSVRFASTDDTDQTGKEQLENLIGPVGRMILSYFGESEEEKRERERKERKAQQVMPDITVTGGRMVRTAEVETQKSKNPVIEKPEFEKREQSDLIYLNGFHHSTEKFHTQCDVAIKKLLVQLLEPVVLGANINNNNKSADLPLSSGVEEKKGGNNNNHVEDEEENHGYSIFDREEESVELLIEAFNVLQANDARQEMQAKKKDKLLQRKALKDLSVEDVSLVLANLHFAGHCQRFKELEISGLSLTYIQTPSDLEELGIKTKAKARELLHHIKVFRVGGVPLRLIQLPPAIQEMLARKEEERLAEEERIAEELAQQQAEANIPGSSAPRKSRKKRK